MTGDVLQIKDLRVHYKTRRGPVKAVEDVTFSLKDGERLGLVGESGSGKTTLVSAIMRLIKPPGRIEEGEVLLDGKDLLSLSEEEMRRVRAAEISVIPQGAMNSLNPVMRVRDQMIHTLRDHGIRATKSELTARVVELLERAGLTAKVGGMYPHELSGGMKQRVVIAMGISLLPKVIIADEPTSALDVVVQREVMTTLRRVQEDLGASVILIGHDMGLMAQFVDRIGVMYAGKLVELGNIRDIFNDPLHPYTQLLIASLPSIEEKGVFKGIPGLTPSLLEAPPGCAFHPRCPAVMPHCSEIVPSLKQVRPERWVSCHLHANRTVQHVSTDSLDGEQARPSARSAASADRHPELGS